MKKLFLWTLFGIIISFNFQCFPSKTPDNKKESKPSAQAAAPKKEAAPKKKIKKEVPPDTKVAFYTANMDDVPTNNDFKVELLTTDDPLKMKILIDYGQNKATDKMDFPDSKFYKKIEIRQGDNKDECVIGFVREDGEFYEMNKVIGSPTQIQIKTLKTYYFGTVTQ